MPTVISIPTNLTAQSAVKFSNDLRSLRQDTEYQIDLSRLNYVEPYGMLVAACALRHVIKTRQATFSALGHQDNSYAAHMGFYHSFGVPYGNKPGAAFGSDTYLPITYIEIGDSQEIDYPSLEIEIKRLAKILVRTDSGNLFDAVFYALREIIRNAGEHSESDRVWYAAQYWRNSDKVEIAVLDEGVGIRASLSQNPKYQDVSNVQALNLSIQEGITRQSIERPYDPWNNTGYGLFITQSLCKSDGEFWLTSYGESLRVRGESRTIVPSFVTGTAVRIVFSSSKRERLDDLISRVVSEKKKPRSKSLLP